MSISEMDDVIQIAMQQLNCRTISELYVKIYNIKKLIEEGKMLNNNQQSIEWYELNSVFGILPHALEDHCILPKKSKSFKKKIKSTP